MIRHVVMWKFKDSAEGRTKRENMELVRERLLALPTLIPQIKRMEVGFDVRGTEASLDVMLLTEFDSLEDLETYIVHPDHQKIGVLLRAVTETRVAVDSECEGGAHD